MKFNKETIGKIGWTNVDSGTITKPVLFLDFEMPVIYPAFCLMLIGFIPTGGSIIAGAFSVDNGSTFINDSVHLDSYSQAGFFANGTAGFTGQGVFDSLFYCGADSTDAGVPQDIEFMIYPSSFRAVGKVSFRGSNEEVMETLSNSANTLANTPRPMGRPNLVRILPYGNGDCNPPTSGFTINSGSYAFLGLSV